MADVKSRREKISSSLEEGSMLILYSGKSPVKSADETYSFTPDRNFYYFTDLDIENAYLVIHKTELKTVEKLFIERNDPKLARWVGEKPSKEHCSKFSKIQEEDISFLDELNGYIGDTLSRFNIKSLYLYLKSPHWENLTKEKLIAQEIQRLFPYVSVKDVSAKIAELRTIKDEEEINNIKKAIEITREGILNIIKNSKPGMYEYELEAYFDFSLRKSGVKDFAFKPIVASGPNSTILHYSANERKTEEGDLVLLDLGAQYNYYSGDISRTFPITRQFSPRQAEIYQIVLNTQKEVQSQVKPGLTLFELNEIAKTSLAESCKKIGLIKTDEELSKYYFHSVSHFLGLDTHDVGGKNIPLKPGMVITNEPGLYIEEEGIGVRIEDDLLITENGCENLSREIPKEIEEIECIWSVL
ncbi:peptidase M24 [Petrotoga sp. HWH.PT.55.6.1]|jgi:Xaa-Pro aminopeptidase|uniref:aminopeptidase P family protein n=1 Tax=unclassified Petrotoga TaxID=2620614 RepID=UPI000CA0777D|nr:MULTISPECIES: aminopeptidase P family protein [unclassified Petrotoga]PNR94384.1 peptidase M24 [Petrotoga sp. HWHPT.55.6.3]RPD35345.1 peptidase M24 [Petrotoga sp. HWH.PT.55.6.1]